MNRAAAIKGVLKSGVPAFAKHSARFANINAAKPVWWLDVPITKLSEAPIINFLLYDARSDVLHFLPISVRHFRGNRRGLVVVKTKTTECFRLELSADGPQMFRDVRFGGEGVEFGQFLARSIYRFASVLEGD